MSSNNLERIIKMKGVEMRVSLKKIYTPTSSYYIAKVYGRYSEYSEEAEGYDADDAIKNLISALFKKNDDWFPHY